MSTTTRGRMELCLTLAALFFFALAAHAAAHGTITIEAAPGSTGEGTITAAGGDPLNCQISGGTASGDCTTFAQAAFFEEIDFTATPGSGSSFLEWELSGEFLGAGCEPAADPTENPCITEFNESQSATLKAKFSGPPPAHGTITIEAAPGSTGEGTITAAGGDPLNCQISGGTASGDCTTFAQAAFFEEIDFTATPGSGSSFLEWELSGEFLGAGCEPAADPTENPCITEFNESQSATLKAKFSGPPPPPAPTVASIAPNHGSVIGGEVVTIAGTNLTGASKVAFGATEIACAGTVATCKVESATEIKATTPAHAAGSVDVRVTTSGGTSAVNPPTDQFLYEAAQAPTVFSVSPTIGSTAGGEAVTIRGTNLTNAIKITFGTAEVTCAGTVATCKVESSTEIKATTPAHAAGSVDVRVVTAGGTSPASATDQFSFVAPPAVTSVSPARGSMAGGDLVVIGGIRLGEPTKVEFGTSEATIVEAKGATITAIAPPHEPGVVDVRVTTVGGTSGTFAQDQYTYMGPVSLAITKSGGGSGSVSCNGGICAPSYPFGTKVTLAASADASSAFAGFAGANCSGSAACTVTLDGPTTVTATFDKNPAPASAESPKKGTPKIAATASTQGNVATLKISCGGVGSCSGTVSLKSAVKQGKKMKNVTIGKSHFEVSPTSTANVKVKITNAQVKKLLKKGKTVKATVAGGGLSGTVKLVPDKGR